MLYLDSSVLVKRYAQEPGSDALRARFRTGEKIFTSVLSYAEVLASVARKHRQRQLSDEDLEEAQERFVKDWSSFLDVIEMNVGTMNEIRGLTTNYNLRGADAVHLSAALWVRNTFRMELQDTADSRLEFGVSDQRLASVARMQGLAVFDPEAA